MPLTLPRASDRKSPPCEAFCQEHWGGCKAAAGTALAHRAPRGAMPRRYQYPALPWHKTLPQTEQSPWAPLRAIQTQDQEKSLKKPYMGTEIYETANRAMQKPQDAHAGSIMTGISNTKYTIYQTMLFIFYWNLVQGLRRLPMPISWRGLWNHRWPMLHPFSENRCWMRQAMGKNNLNLRTKGFFPHYSTKTTWQGHISI